jgi:hypothetical protein
MPMVATADMPLTPSMPSPGVACPCCKGCEMTLGIDGRGRGVLNCAGCHTFVRLLRRHGDDVSALDLADADDRTTGVPTVGSWFLALVLGGDGISRPVALGDNLGKTWSGALHSNLWGTVFIMATDPPRPAARQGDFKGNQYKSGVDQLIDTKPVAVTEGESQ